MEFFALPVAALLEALAVAILWIYLERGLHVRASPGVLQDFAERPRRLFRSGLLLAVVSFLLLALGSVLVTLRALDPLVLWALAVIPGLLASQLMGSFKYERGRSLRRWVYGGGKIDYPGPSIVAFGIATAVFLTVAAACAFALERPEHRSARVDFYSTIDQWQADFDKAPAITVTSTPAAGQSMSLTINQDGSFSSTNLDVDCYATGVCTPLSTDAPLEWQHATLTMGFPGQVLQASTHLKRYLPEADSVGSVTYTRHSDSWLSIEQNGHTVATLRRTAPGTVTAVYLPGAGPSLLPAGTYTWQAHPGQGAASASAR